MESQARRAFKDYFDVALAQQLAAAVQRVQPTFAAASFVQQVAHQIAPLELKARVAVFAAALRDHLPADYPAALAVLAQILGDELPDEAGMFDLGYHLMPVAAFVEIYGPDQADAFDQSLAMLHAITRRHTAEFALRPFLLRYQQRTLAALQQWVQDPNAHVRRAVSESTRPRLPWASRLPAFIAEPQPVLDLLEQLQHDPSPYVRKSVANNLNDISRDHPEQVLALAARWQANGNQHTPALLRHALRTLIKQGNPAALALLGHAAPASVRCHAALAPDTLPIGDTLHIAATLHNTDTQPHRLIIDYRMHFVSANGSPRSKVFKLAQIELAAGEQITLTRQHSFQIVSVRRYYPGTHRIEVQVNGVVLAAATFVLTAPQAR